MFDFFKDAYLELSGLDLKAIEDEKNKDKEKRKSLFSRSSKIIITIIGILYLVMAGTNIYVIIRKGFEPILFKYVFLSLLAICVMITIHFRKKEIQIVSLVGIAVFIMLNYLIRIS